MKSAYLITAVLYSTIIGIKSATFTVVKSNDKLQVK